MNVSDYLNIIESDVYNGRNPREEYIYFILENQNKLNRSEFIRFGAIKERINAIYAKENNRNARKGESLRDRIRFEGYRTKEKKVNQEEILVVSDLHGKMEKWEFIRSELLKRPNLRVEILGDAMDRGPNGIEMLLEIKEWSDKGRVDYLPGNHDIFTYNYVKSSEFLNRNDVDDSFKGKLNRMFNSARSLLKVNKGNATMQKLASFDSVVRTQKRNGRIQNEITLKELMNWLGKQPIQKIIENPEEEKKYALAHAIFDTDLYNEKSSFCLEDAFKLEVLGKEDTNLFKKFKNVMWYREGEPIYTMAPLSLPKDHIMVVGHTNQEKVNRRYIKNERHPIWYVDCGNGNLSGLNLNSEKVENIEERALNCGR